LQKLGGRWPEMYSVVLSNQAIKNLTGIVEYIAADNPDAAEKTGFELVNIAMSLGSMPYRGSKVKKRRGVLKLIHGNYLLYYRVDERKRTVQVISVKHGGKIK
jgi:toxin ParE1/3/4